MKRNLRSKINRPIIELSNSDDEDYETSSKSKDKDYTVAGSKTRENMKTNFVDKEATTKEITVRGTGCKNVKSTKRKFQEESAKIPTNKRHKPSVQSWTLNAEESRLRQEDQIKGDTEQDSSIVIASNYSFEQCAEWTDVDYISEINSVDKRVAENVVKLFKEDNTIPFIARYRKNLTGSMDPDQLRALKESFDRVKVIKHRAATIIRAIDKLGKWSPEIHSSIASTRSLADLEHIYSLFKPTSKRSLAEKARELGLGRIGDAVLQGQKISPLALLVDERKEGLRSEEQVRDGIVHIIADIISKDKEVFDKVISLRRTSVIEIQTTRCKTTAGDSNGKSKNATDEYKYETYFNFKTIERNIKPHQILAIIRAESRKILSVKIVVPDAFRDAFKKYCSRRYAPATRATELHLDLLDGSIDYAYKKLIKPLVVRRVRTEMKERAEIASIQVFATNVKQLLLAPPVRGKIVLGIDPGFYHGCKLAVVSEHGDVLDTAVIYPHKNLKAVSYEQSVNALIELVTKHRCTVLALGNATACRETELFLTKMIRSKAFGSLDVTYAIVDEAGASIYSCSPEAKSEFPNLDPNFISAVSIARRLQDPLAELVKVEPKHLGVGMYQHDLPEKQLLSALDEVIVEAVSFVGVDINVASKCLLRRIAGLTNAKAANIIEWRTKYGAFKNRKQLLKVKGIGSKTYEQCAGFIRILPETATTKSSLARKSKSPENRLNPLDQTWIHPESYAIANKFLEYCQCDLSHLGTLTFIEKINLYAKAEYAKLAAQFSSDEATIGIIIKSFTMRKDEDVRLKSDYPLFRNGMQSIDDLSIGTVLSGAVRNVTHFGAFIDVGVGRDGLIHVTCMKNQTLRVGQRVEVKVLFIEPIRNRIGLELIKILE